MAEVRLQRVSKFFDDIHAVNDLSLAIQDKECIVLLGPTGAGKTTVLRLVAGLERPDAGQVFIDQRDVTSVPPAARDLTFVFQHYSLYPHYSVFDNLAFPLRAPGRGMKAAAIKKRVTEVAELLHIRSKLANKVTELSGGEMQRVSIGRSLVRNPKIFLMDEPLASLDAQLRESMRTELKRIQYELAATMLYVTHDQFEAMTLADQIGVLRDGQLVQLGSPTEIYEKPCDVYVAQRLGTPRINLLNARELQLRSMPAQTVTIGIRPEDVRPAASGALAGRVVKLEYKGENTTVTLAMKGETLQMVLAAGYSAQMHQDMQLQLRNPLFFDGQDRLIH